MCKLISSLLSAFLAAMLVVTIAIPAITYMNLWKATMVDPDLWTSQRETDPKAWAERMQNLLEQEADCLEFIVKNCDKCSCEPYFTDGCSILCPWASLAAKILPKLRF